MRTQYYRVFIVRLDLRNAPRPGGNNKILTELKKKKCERDYDVSSSGTAVFNRCDWAGTFEYSTNISRLKTEIQCRVRLSGRHCYIGNTRAFPINYSNPTRRPGAYSVVKKKKKDKKMTWKKNKTKTDHHWRTQIFPRFIRPQTRASAIVIAIIMNFYRILLRIRTRVCACWKRSAIMPPRLGGPGGGPGA